MAKPRSEMTPVERLHADAAEDFEHYHLPETGIAARDQRAFAAIEAQRAGGTHRGDAR